jgi:hypothetical protein
MRIKEKNGRSIPFPSECSKQQESKEASIDQHATRHLHVLFPRIQVRVASWLDSAIRVAEATLLATYFKSDEFVHM